ncbi:hypothetical protein SLS57_008343 [Botryosphaeria dothidea]
MTLYVGRMETHYLVHLVKLSPKDKAHCMQLTEPFGASTSYTTLVERLSRLFSRSKPNADAEVTGQTPDDLDYHPRGYPQLAAFLNCDENFAICRRYGLLHMRLMLHRQDELRELEDELMSLDADSKADDSRCLTSRELDDELDPAGRKELLEKIDVKLKQYDELVLRARQMAALPPVPERNFNSVKTYVENRAPLCENEVQIMERQQDFVSLVEPREGSWFDAMLEDFLSKLPVSIAKRRSTKDPYVRLYSKLRIDRFARLITAVLAVALLMAPVVVLFMHDESGAVKIAVILVFTLFFAAALSIFTKAKRHEVFAATAAYCAVLVVFLGNFN